ncbi:MAG: hypothetical protein Q9191_007369 [Dirinaria sp. TL-2023a]
MKDPDEPTDKPASPSISETLSSITSPRSLKQLSLFCAGSTFFALSMLITRRAVTRRYTSTVPRFYRPSNKPSPATFNGPLEAFEALSLATLNVTTFMTMLAGGTFWAFDISTLDELKQRIERKRVIDGRGSGNAVDEAEEELKNWIAKTLSMKDDTRSKGNAEEQEQGDHRGRPR